MEVRFTPEGQQLVVADYSNKRVQCLALDGSFVRNIPLGAIINLLYISNYSKLVNFVSGGGNAVIIANYCPPTGGGGAW